MKQYDAWRMIPRRAKAVRIMSQTCNHSFKVTGITNYLKNGGKLKQLNRWQGMNLFGPRAFMIAGGGIKLG